MGSEGKKPDTERSAGQNCANSGLDRTYIWDVPVNALRRFDITTGATRGLSLAETGAETVTCAEGVCRRKSEERRGRQREL